jgi:hypothetical protein
MEGLFHIGQKVVCVNDSCGRITGLKQLKTGEVYIIKDIFSVNSNSVDLLLNDFDAGWDSKRFRPLQEISNMTFEEAIELVTEKATTL